MHRSSSRRPHARAARRLTAAAGAVALALAVLPQAAASSDDREDSGSGHGGYSRTGTYTNPVSADFADTFADPAVLRGKDGWWYAAATTDPLRETPQGADPNPRSIIPMARSANLVDWEYIGDAFTERTIPEWADTAPRPEGDPQPTASVWAADLRYVDGQYRLYYVVTETTVTDEYNDNAIGVATSDSPWGPWVDSGAPVVGPRRAPGTEVGDANFLWTFDPTHVRDTDGSQHLVYGSYYGGIWTVPLDATGTRQAGEQTQITIDNKYEGSYVLQRDGWWYLFVSSANCCNGAATGYSVHVGRSREIDGEYVDKEGVELNTSRAGGTPVIAPNGNRWIGTGHNAVVTDLSGQDWIVYHALDRDDPYLDGREIGSITERPMLIDRLDWVDGWPTARAGKWASDDEQPAPLAGGRRTVTGFDDGLDDRPFRADDGWDLQEGAAVSTDGGESRITRAVRGRDARDGVRVEADVRVAGGSTGLSVESRRGGGVQASVDADGVLTVSTVDRRGRVTDAADVPVGAEASFDGADWHALSLVVAGGTATAELSDARLGDPLARVTLDVPSSGRDRPARRAGAVAVGAGGSVDNLSVAAVAPPPPVVEPEPLGVLDAQRSDEFDGPLDERWLRLRDPQVTVDAGELAWPVQNADLGGAGESTAALLLQEPPAGDWTVETSVDVSALGVDGIRNYQQGGIVVHENDDRWVRLSTVAIWNTRQNEFGIELPWATEADPDATIQGGTIAGPPGERSWLRVSKRTSEAGELLLSSFTSRDGTTWVRGGTWTMPAGTTPQVGLFSGGGTADGTEEPTVLTFDYLRWYLP